MICPRSSRHTGKQRVCPNNSNIELCALRETRAVTCRPHDSSERFVTIVNHDQDPRTRGRDRYRSPLGGALSLSILPSTITRNANSGRKGANAATSRDTLGSRTDDRARSDSRVRVASKISLVPIGATATVVIEPCHHMCTRRARLRGSDFFMRSRRAPLITVTTGDAGHYRGFASPTSRFPYDRRREITLLPATRHSSANFANVRRLRAFYETHHDTAQH